MNHQHEKNEDKFNKLKDNTEKDTMKKIKY